MAGSEAGNSRVKVSKIKDDKKYDRIKDGLKKFNLDALVIAGGDDTGSVVVDLSGPRHCLRACPQDNGPRPHALQRWRRLNNQPHC
jgi:hypothetical protein